MKKIIIILTILIFSYLNLKSEITYTPLFENYNGVIEDYEKIIVYGSNGSIIVSYDEGENWERKYNLGNIDIYNIVFFNNNYYVLSKTGNVFIFDFQFNKIINSKNLELGNLISLQIYKDFIYIRDENKIYKINKDLNIINSSNSPFSISNVRNYKHSSNFVIQNDNIFTFNNDLNIYKFNEDLSFLDTLKAFPEEVEFKFTNYLLFTKNNEIYIHYLQKLYKTTDFKKFETLTDSIKYLTYNLKKINDDSIFVFTSNTNAGSNFQLFKYSKGFFNKDTLENIINVDLLDNFLSMRSNNSELLISKNYYFLVGENNFIAKLERNSTNSENNLTIISKSGLSINNNLPIVFNDNKIKYLDGLDFQYSLYSAETYDNGITYKQTTDTSKISNKIITSIINNRLRYYDKTENKIYIIADVKYKVYDSLTEKNVTKQQNKLIITDNEYNLIDTFYIENNLSLSANPFSNLKKSKDSFYYLLNNNFGASIIQLNLNKGLRRLDGLLDHKFYEYVVLNDTTFIVLSHNFKTNNVDYFITNDFGQNWMSLKNYKENYTVLNSNHITLNNKHYLLSVIYDYFNLKIIYELYDIEKKEFVNLLTLNSSDDGFENYHKTYINLINNKLIIPINNKIYIKDFNNLSKDWKIIVLENNGIILEKLIISNGNIIANFNSDVLPYNQYLIKGLDKDILSSVESTEEFDIPTFLFTNTYPNPARDEVNVSFHYDQRYNLENATVSVFDIYGKEIVGLKPIFNSKSSYQAEIKLNTQSIPSGIYILNLKFGNTTKAVKFNVIK